MTKEIDARGLDCPQPVINAKKALEQYNEIIIIVDNITAVENLKRLADSMDCQIIELDKDGGHYLQITRDKVGKKDLEDITIKEDSNSSGPTVVVLSDDSMGGGDRELGNLLIQGFLHTLLEVSNIPETLLFFNNGVKLTVEGSEVIEELLELEKKGSKLLVCGTCLNYFKVKEKLKVGNVSNMYEIVEAMSTSGRLIQI